MLPRSRIGKIESGEMCERRLQRPEPVDVGPRRFAVDAPHVRLARGRNRDRELDVGDGIHLELESVEPLSSINGDSGEAADAFRKQSVVAAQIRAEIELLHCAPDRAVHLDVGDHTARYTALLFFCRTPCMPFSEFLHLFRTLANLQFAHLLALADVAAEISIALRLRSGHTTHHTFHCGHLFAGITRYAAAPADFGLVRELCDRQQVVKLHVGVSSRQSNAEPGCCAV